MLNTYTSISKQRAVTLVELAISLAIIGLLIATITTGYNLIHSAEIRKTITNFNNLKIAIDEFYQEYHYLPGDLPTATNYFGNYANSNNKITGAYNGDGNSVINNDEDIYAWQHLNQAKFLPGNYTGLRISNSLRFSPQVNAPGVSISNNAFFHFYNIVNPIYGYRGHAIELDSNDNSGALNAKDANAIDSKLDDGKPSTGLITSINANNLAGCVSNQTEYNLSISNKNCILTYWYRKN